MTSLFALPNELILSSLCSRFPCRDHQIRSLALLFSVGAAPIKNIVLYGLEATGKYAITKALLDSLSSHRNATTASNNSGGGEYDQHLRYAIVKSAECITGRHLLERTLGAVAKALAWNGSIGRCENMAQLVVEIGRLLEWWASLHHDEAVKQRFVLVFHGVDHQRDAPPTLLPGLARLGEIIPNLTIVFIVTAPRANFLHFHGAPHIQFSSYTKSELLQILDLVEPTPQLTGGSRETGELWSRFCSIVWDSLAKHSCRDVLSFRSLCLRLWPAFVAPMFDGTYSSNQFTRLVVANRAFFQNEIVLVPSIVSDTPNTLTVVDKSKTASSKFQGIGTQLPNFSRLLLVAAYLASFNPPRTDQVFFMKASAARRRKKGGGTALSKGRPGVVKHRKISRKLLGPQAFVLERMLAIFHAIKVDADDRREFGKGKAGGNDTADIHMAIATLASLRLLVKLGATNAADTLDGSSRWRVALGWEAVRGIARTVGVEAEDYLAD